MATTGEREREREREREKIRERERERERAILKAPSHPVRTVTARSRKRLSHESVLSH